MALAQEQLPAARQQPGFGGYYMLTSAEAGQIMIISLWETREQMPAGVLDQGRAATGMTPPHLEIYEVALHS